MAGSFELFTDMESQVRFTRVAPVKDVREFAGTGLINDLCPARV